MNLKYFTLFTVLALLSSCAMPALRPDADRVLVKANPPADCKELGVINSGWTTWGSSTESLNSMRNQTAEKGGNIFVPRGDGIGFAYFCKNDSLTSSN